jgi:APA family basic amino acid/polyamine antiporter
MRVTKAVPAGPGATAVIIARLSIMFGAGVVIGLAPATSAAGRWVFAGIGVAALIAICTAVAASPSDGPAAYLDLRQRLGGQAAVVSGALGITGRVVAAAAVAGAFGVYAFPERPLFAAVGVVLLTAGLLATGLLAAGLDVTGLDVTGLDITARDAAGSRVLARLSVVVAALVFSVLAVFVVVCLAIAPELPAGPVPADLPGTDDVTGLIPAAGLMFFAFLGNESTGERLSGSRHRLVGSVTVLLALAGYLVVAWSALYQLGGPRLAASPAPLRSAMAAADAVALDRLVTGAVALATFSTLIVVLGSVRRSASTMAAHGDLPRSLLATGWRGVPTRLVVLGWLATTVGVVLLPPATALGVGSCLMLGHYALANAAAALATSGARRVAARIGLGLCVVVGVALAVFLLAALLVAAVVIFAATMLSLRGARR